MLKKIFKMAGIFEILNFMLMINTYAFDVTDLTGTKVTNSELTNKGNGIITVLTVIGTIVSVIVLIILGLKYMLGSVEERAEYKKTLLPYVIGASLTFAASAIAGVIYSFAINLG